MTIETMKLIAVGVKVKAIQTGKIFTMAYNDGIDFDLVSDESGKHLMTFDGKPGVYHTIGYTRQPELSGKIAAGMEVA